MPNDTQRAALLVMDVQPGVVDRIGDKDAYLARARSAVDHAHAQGIRVVLSTLREAADKDYTLTVLSDLCADRDAEVHRVLLEKVFPKQATVVTAAEWIASA